MKILVIDGNALALDFCLRAQDEGHEVRWFIRDKEPGIRTVGDGLVPKTNDWQQWMRWAELIFLPDNAVYMRDLEWYRKRGFPIYGPNDETARWELERGTGMDILEKHGIKTIPGEMFTSYDKAIDHVRRTKKRFVSKPSGDADKALSYVSKGPKDMIFMLEKWKRLGKMKAPFILQEFKPGIEMAVGAWVGPHGFDSPWCENWEFKKLMDGDMGVATGEQGCYSADTEVLTSDGWKFWPDVTMEDELAALVDGKTVFERPSAVVAYDIDGPMVQWKNRSVDVLVTPNHNMYVAGQSSARRKVPEWKFVAAEDCTEAQYMVRRTADWEGDSPETFVCPGNTWHNGVGQRTTPDVEVPFEEWCKFLGIYFAEGSTSGSQVNIAQAHPVKYERVKGLLANFPITPVGRTNGLVINCAAVARMVRPFGRSYEKRVPDYILNAKKEHIQLFLDAFCLGDGHVQKNGSRLFYTSNPGLADDLQELMLRVGALGIIKKLKPKTKFGQINGRTIYQRRPAYVVYERARKVSGWLDARDRKIVDYKGKVYCATVSSHVLFVRRNGKPLWCGNTVLRYDNKSLLADRVLGPLEEALVDAGYIGYVDVNCIISEDGTPWPLEFTMRPGWPLFNIQQQLHGSTATWMAESLAGKSVRKNFSTKHLALGVVVSMPDYPYCKLPREAVSGVPIYNMEKHHSKLHPCELKLGKAPGDGATFQNEPILVSAGTYLLVGCGLGETVSQAKREAYKVVESLEIPNSPMWRTDIGQRLEKQLPKLHGMGYAKTMRF
ncbi:MAG: hypothetical protein KGL63_13740 [Betaproteobacteria bacterium]|nr:hypothetical protein [Betaproteobacteria bacterium]